MSRFFLILFAAILLVSCESREDKAQKAVAQELKGVLYDFDSYEPIKTKIDSAFFSPYYCEEAQNLIMYLMKAGPEFEEAKSEYNRALSHIALCNSPYLSYAKQEAIRERCSYREDG